jgi:hypothetical protein
MPSDSNLPLSEKQTQTLERLRKTYPNGAVEWRDGEAYLVVKLERSVLQINLRTETAHLSA